MSTSVPRGARGVQLKSKALLRYDYANMRWFIQDGRRRFNVSSACLMRRYHKWREKFGLQLEIPAMRGALNFWITISSIKDRCRPGGTTWCVAPNYLINFFMREDHSLPSIFMRG